MGINLLERFKNYVENNGLITRQDKVLLTVSGGVDSMVMLSLFVECGYNVGVAHCNFQLRGAESDSDEVLVASQSRKYGVECYNRRFDTKGEMERTGESMEMAARRLRYAWFEELCDEHGYTVVSVAHHADDSIETFFINLLRGTGLRGLTGIGVQHGRVVRPLMFASRKDILEYAVFKRIPFTEDSTNRSTKYLRNKIRLGLIPRIREINSKFTDLMRRNISRLTDAQLFITASIEKLKADVMSQNDGIYTIHVDRIDASYPLNFVVYELLSSSFGFKSDVIDALYRSLDEHHTGKRFYSKDYVAYVDRRDIVVAAIEDEDLCRCEVPKGAMRAYCGNSVLYFESVDIDAIESFCVAENVALIDADKLHYPLTIRRWQDGDWFIPFGMSGKKKISDFFVDQKMSMAEKKRQFLLFSGEDIVWVIGRRIDDRYRLESQTENVLRIYKDTI